MRCMGQLFRAVVLTVLLHGAESWTLTTKQIDKLEVWQTKIARIITRKQIHPNPRDPDEWIYPNSAETLKRLKLVDIRTLIERKRRMVKTYLETESAQYALAIARAVPHNYYWWNRNEEMDTTSDIDIDNIMHTQRELTG